ncbi:putative e14 prophage, inversion of adjacent DNA [Burkholderia pseudomallei MSHR4378]|nr:putative e14 prophage, inversion of adjacent DNA [Burkholderia pseudomallei MSHR4378]
MHEQKAGCGASGPNFLSNSKRSCVGCMTLAAIPSATWPNCFRFPVQPCIEPSLVGRKGYSADSIGHCPQTSTSSAFAGLN